MGRHVLVAAGVGAVGGATVSVVAYVGVTWGTDIYFRLVVRRETKREQRSAACLER